MAEKFYLTRHHTLKAVKEAGLRIYAYCSNPDCHWSSVLNVDELIDRLGEQQSTMPPDLVPRLYCSQCGGKDVSLVLSAGRAPVADGFIEHQRSQRPKDEC